jgi:CelD/BcsL family acetyltransferase involved in cellulose biosynthesis
MTTTNGDLSIVEARDGVAWDSFVAQAEGATFCHLSGWREVLSDELGAEPRYHAAVDREGAYRGVLPLFRVRSRLFGHFLVSVPYLNYGGPLGTRAARRELSVWAMDEARRSRVDLLELRTRVAPEPGVPESQPDGGPGVRPDPSQAAELRSNERKVTVLLELPESAETIWSAGFSSKLRSQIRRPSKEGMVTRFGGDQLTAFYEVFSRNMRDLGTPVLPRRFFEALARTFPREVVFGVVYHGEVPVAGGCGFVWGGEYEMTWASSLREYNTMAPNMLLYWSFIEWAIGAGARVFNYGRCTPGSGTHRFKRQWGGRDLALPWAQWSSRGVESTPSPERPVYRAATALWRRLPLGVANLAGPLLARKIP